MVSLLEGKTQYTFRDADESAELLARKLRAREAFSFFRFGDGFLECVSGAAGQTCDGEIYSSLLGSELLRAWLAVVDAEGPVYLGDWMSASFDSDTERTRYEEQYAALVGGRRRNWLHFEALLLMRESAALVDFYRAVKEDPRRKLFMGPARNKVAAKMLGAEFLETPMQDLHAHTNRLYYALCAREFDVLLYGAGMAGNIPAVRCWQKFPERTYINLGSAMDPLFGGRTRKQQISPERARQLFRELL